MRRFVFYIFSIAVFFLAFVLSTAATFIWEDKYWGYGVGSFAKCAVAGEELTNFGGFRSYEFYDGMKLAFSRAKFDSAEAARRCYQSDLQYASKIVEREILFDEMHEKVVGERVVAIFPPNEYSTTEWTNVMSLDGDTIFEITSPLLQRTLSFEKEWRKY